MNAQRRNKVKVIISALNDLQSQIAVIQDEEEEAYDNLPENLQFSERATAMEESLGNLDFAYGEIDDIIGYLESAIEQ